MKLIAEIRSISSLSSRGNQTIEWIKAIAGLAGVLTAIAALLGLFFSVNKAREEAVRAAVADRRQQINANIALVADANVAKQLAGITALESFFWSETSEGRIQLISLLANMLAVEKKKPVRDAIVASLRRSLTPKLDQAVVSAAIERMASLSVALVAEGKLDLAVLEYDPQDAESESVQARAHSLSNAVQLAVRLSKGKVDLSGIYCVACDFAGLTLNDADFGNAILLRADFSRAQLQRSHFEGANLQRTSFVGADLRQSHFEGMPREASRERRRLYMLSPDLRMAPGFRGPNFSCADMRGATFVGHSIFSAILPERFYGATGGVFIGADLRGVDFSDTRIVGTVPKGQDNFSIFGGGGVSGDDGQRSTVTVTWTFNDQLTDVEEKHRALFSGISRSFAGSNWEEARLPAVLRSALSKFPPSKFLEFSPEDVVCAPKVSAGFKPLLALKHRQHLATSDIDQALGEGGPDSYIPILQWKGERRIALSDAELALSILVNTRFAIVKDDPTPLEWVGNLTETHWRAAADRLPAELVGVLDAVRPVLGTSKAVPRSNSIDDFLAYRAEKRSLVVREAAWKRLLQMKAMVDSASESFVTANRPALKSELQRYLPPVASAASSP
ncbi:pentapeptide repeat-containing protein [Roseateles sp. L2-2]|uniref:pentapeptide repeat-containing protein n=1 Tax=Roseateles sp. L2-2 TaxID=3422597 RepID=UPI003D35F8C5